MPTYVIEYEAMNIKADSEEMLQCLDGLKTRNIIVKVIFLHLFTLL